MMTEQLTQALSIATAPIVPQTFNDSTQKTGGLDLSRFKRALFLVSIGSVAEGGSLTVKLQESVDTTDGNFTDVTGGAATAVAAANQLVTLEIRSEQLTAGKRYVRAVLTETGNADVVAGCIPLGGEAIQKPARAHDHASVVERLVV